MTVRLAALWDGAWALHREPGGDALALRRPVEAAIAEARAAGGHTLFVRETLGGDARAYLDLLASLGFAKRNDRVEYASPVADLPDDAGTPLAWMPLGDRPLAHAAALMGAFAVGDPDVDPDEDALAALTGFLADDAFTGGPGCVHLATLDGRDAAIVVAQVSAADGFARITYMALDPALRGRGLGAWVHRHGFAMLQAQGGLTYRGGTLAQNASMRRLFERHGCAELRRMQEWALPL